MRVRGGNHPSRRSGEEAVAVTGRSWRGADASVRPPPKDTDRVELALVVSLRGAHRRHRKQFLLEDTVLTPNVIEIRRGCAHGTTVALPKATAGARQNAE